MAFIFLTCGTVLSAYVTSYVYVL